MPSIPVMPVMPVIPVGPVKPVNPLGNLGRYSDMTILTRQCSPSHLRSPANLKRRVPSAIPPTTTNDKGRHGTRISSKFNSGEQQSCVAFAYLSVMWDPNCGGLGLAVQGCRTAIQLQSSGISTSGTMTCGSLGTNVGFVKLGILQNGKNDGR